MKNVPKLRFKEFGDSYTNTKLGNFTKASQGLQIAISNRFTEPSKDRVFYITIPFTQGNKVEYIENPKKSVLCFKDDILVVRTGSGVGKILRGFEGAFHNNFFKLNTKKTLNDNYLFFFLHKPKTKFLMNTYAGTSAIPDLNHGDFYSIRINLPENVKEQQKIASFLTSIDTKIEQLTKKEELLKQYKKGVMQKIFSQEIRFRADDGGEFGEWEEKKLGEITYKVSKKNKENIPYPVYSINNKEGFIPQGQQFEGMNSSNRNYDISLYKIIGEETFAYNPARINVGSLGYSGTLKDIIISSLYVCFKSNNDINDLFLLQYFSTYDFNKSVLRNTEGGVRDYLFYENFSNIKTKIPTYDEQVTIVKFLSSIDTKIEQVQTQLEATRKFKEGLLQQMFV